MKRLKLWMRRLLGLPIYNIHVAEANGAGPCMRCVGRALADGPTTPENNEPDRSGDFAI